MEKLFEEPKKLSKELENYILDELWGIFDNINRVKFIENCDSLYLMKGKYKVSVVIKDDTTIDSLKEDIKNEVWKEAKFYLDIFDKLG